MNDARDDVRRLLIVHTRGGLGDLITTSPLAEALKQRFPTAEITVWASAAHAPVLEQNPNIARIWTASPDGPIRPLARAIGQARYDLAVFPWPTERQAWLVRLVGVPRRVGPARRLAYSFLFSDRVRVRTEFGDRHSHWVDIQLDYARALGWTGMPPVPRIRLTAAERDAAAALLSAQGVADADVLYALHIGKGLRIDKVTWPIERFVDIGRALAASRGARVLVTGSAVERQLAGRVADRIGPGALNLAATTADLRLLCGVIDRCAVFVGVDSGPMHVAAALGVPVVGLFPLRSDCPPRWGAYGVDTRVVRTTGWECPVTCVKEKCLDFECLTHIDAAAAVSGASDLRPVGLARLARREAPRLQAAAPGDS